MLPIPELDRLMNLAAAELAVRVGPQVLIAVPVVVAGPAVVGAVGPVASRLQAVAANRLRVDPSWDRRRPNLLRLVDPRWVVQVGPMPDLVHQSPILRHRWPGVSDESDQPRAAADAAGPVVGLVVAEGRAVVRTATPETEVTAETRAIPVIAGSPPAVRRVLGPQLAGEPGMPVADLVVELAVPAGLAAVGLVVAVASGLEPVEAVAEPGG